MKIPDYKGAKNYFVSPQGLEIILNNKTKTQFYGQDVLWTTDARKELPVRIGVEGVAAEKPTTLIQEFKKTLTVHKDRPALSTKINGVWYTYTYSIYYEQCLKFAKSLIALNLEEYAAVNIIGFNAPEWCFAFYGSMLARCLPVGIYTTNSQQTCEYIAEHSQAKIIIAQNRDLIKKYIPLLQKGKIQLIVFYNDPQYHPQSHVDRIISYDAFIRKGERVELGQVEKRTQKIKPGNCCTLIYTSGTTGMPKGVMLSHDNYTWTKKSIKIHRKGTMTQQSRSVSYLPLSHAAGQFADIVSTMIQGMHVYFADNKALQGTLFKTLLQVRPTHFFSVPRIWQKVYDKVQQQSLNQGFLKTKLLNWAKELGIEGSMQQRSQQKTSLQYKIAKVLVFNRIRESLGLDKCKDMSYGSAPLDPNIRKQFHRLGIFLLNGYGMSESTCPQTFTDDSILNCKNPDEFYREVGRSLPGTELTIVKANQKDGDGQICYRGRNTFMGYFKNPEETAKTIDQQGFLHSGDNGKLNKEGLLFITGRKKQLIITAGGQNIPPLLIQNQIRATLPFISNIIVIGDQRKYLTCFITLKEDPPSSGKLDDTTKKYFASRGCQVGTLQEAIKDEKVRKIIDEGLKKANLKAISRAQHVQDFMILPQDFSIQNGILTASLKLKRNEALKKYANQIQALYRRASL